MTSAPLLRPLPVVAWPPLDGCRRAAGCVARLLVFFVPVDFVVRFAILPVRSLPQTIRQIRHESEGSLFRSGLPNRACPSVITVAADSRFIHVYLTGPPPPSLPCSPSAGGPCRSKEDTTAAARRPGSAITGSGSGIVLRAEVPHQPLELHLHEQCADLADAEAELGRQVVDVAGAWPEVCQDLTLLRRGG